MDKLKNLINDAIIEAKTKPSNRETSLVVTKLQEALLWWGAASGAVEVAGMGTGVGKTAGTNQPGASA